MDLEVRAALESPAQKVKRANGLLREAARSLAQMVDDDTTVVGTKHVHDADSAESAAELIALGRGRHGAVDVVVIARPGRATRNTPTTAPEGAKETTDEHHDGDGRAASGARERGAVGAGAARP